MKIKRLHYCANNLFYFYHKSSKNCSCIMWYGGTILDIKEKMPSFFDMDKGE